MAARSTFQISDEVRAVLARSTITATAVTLPEQLDRKLYEQVNKALLGAGGKWNRSKKAHVFDRDPREALGLAVETGKATNIRTALQSFYTPGPLAARVVAAADIALFSPGRVVINMLEPSIGEGALARAAAEKWGEGVRITGYDIDKLACVRAANAIEGMCYGRIYERDFLSVDPTTEGCDYDVVLMNPPFTGGADIAHVTHAWRFVRPGGALVAITSPSWRTANTKAAVAFRKLLDSVSAEREDIPRGTFEHTDTATVLILMRKPAAPR